MLAPYINIHSHSPIELNTQGIENFHLQDITDEQIFPNSFSLGLHPWYLKGQDLFHLMDVLESHSRNPNLKAIGECGLDRIVSINIELQKEAFRYQLEIAERCGKALIVHNVKAFSDILEIFKELKPSIPIIFHAYSGNEDILNKLLQFNVYFSFGHMLYNDNSKASRVISKIPRNCLFLETDDRSGKIEDIYAVAAKRISISVIELRNQIYYTYKSLFL